MESGHAPNKLQKLYTWFSGRLFTLTQTWLNVECVKVPVPAHQVLPLTAYILEAGYSMSTTQANEI